MIFVIAYCAIAYATCGAITYVAIMFDYITGIERRDPWRSLLQAAVWPWTLWDTYR